MGLIKKSTELSLNQKLKMLIYGQPGTGKTTLALSAPKPLLFDFDNGVHRVNFNHLKDVDTVQIGSYADFMSVLDNEDLTSYQSIVIDTGGKLLDHMAEYIVKKTPKYGRANGMLTLQGYGERKAIFTALIRRLSIMDKHIIFVAHQETRHEGDDIRYVPQFGGSNYDSLVTELDLVGYMEANGRERVITFDPTDRNDGKNTCNLPPLVKLPAVLDAEGNPTADNDFLTASVISPYYARLARMRGETEEYNQLIDLLKNTIQDLSADQINEALADIPKWNHIGNSKLRAAKMIQQRAGQLGLNFDRKTKQYV